MMLLLIENTDAIYQFTIIIIFVTTIIFFVAMYWNSLSLQKSAIEQEKTKNAFKFQALELDKIQLRNKILEESEKTEHEKNLRLEQAISLKNQELVSSTLLLNHQDRTFAQMKSIVESLEKERPSKHLTKLKRIIHSEQAQQDTCEQFRIRFNAVQPHFLNHLEKNFPHLTQNDVRHCAFIKMRLSTKEIAQILNINPTSVQISRVRLKKKLGLPGEVDLRQYIQTLQS